jgi:hypothetical protein
MAETGARDKDDVFSTPPLTNVFSIRKAQTGARDKDDVFSTPPLTNVFSIHMAQTGARDKDDVFGLGEYRRDVPRRLQTPIENTLVRGGVENTFSFSIAVIENTLVRGGVENTFSFSIAVMSRAASRRLFGLV